jgi:nitroimidazol reductase NimA-like FMN-containing flavoprotein (pyridoxamine 5'-phosphate oxidase superfamily)
MTMTTDPSTVDCTPSPLVRVRRKPGRARYDMAAVHAVLDAAPFSHVATVRNGRPVVLPMAHGRLDGSLVLHGSHAAGLFRDAAAGSPVCITATLLDGLVLGRSARNHSMNYRSVTIHGHATAITEPDEIIAGLQAVVEHLIRGRWQQVRKPSTAESARRPSGKSPSHRPRPRHAADRRWTPTMTAACQYGPAIYRRGWYSASP